MSAVDVLAALLAAIDLRFKSGNSVPVERAYIKASEWQELRTAIARAMGERE